MTVMTVLAMCALTILRSLHSYAKCRQVRLPSHLKTMDIACSAIDRGCLLVIHRMGGAEREQGTLEPLQIETAVQMLLRDIGTMPDREGRSGKAIHNKLMFLQVPAHAETRRLAPLE